MEAVSWSTEIVFFNESFILASGNGFWLIRNLLLLFRAFFCWWTPFLKLNVGQFLKKNIISARWNHFLGYFQIFLCIKSFVTISVYGFWVNFKQCAFIRSFFFVLLESITETRWKPVFFDFFSSFFPSSGNGFSIEC